MRDSRHELPLRMPTFVTTGASATAADNDRLYRSYCEYLQKGTLEHRDKPEGYDAWAVANGYHLRFRIALDA